MSCSSIWTSDFGYHMRAQGLDWRVVPSKCIVRSDPRLLEQILRNLLSNAVKFTTSGKVLLGCRRHGATMNIEVWDTGPGIPPEHRLAIFDEFRQIDNPARERSKGLGLGLAIVQRLASLLDHRIDLRSRPGRGSMFSIAVPLAEGVPAATEPSGQKLSFERAETNVTILVIEDDPTIRELLDLLLRDAGYHPISVVDGVTALACAERPDLVVADFNLPNGPNGVEVIAELRRRFERKIPAIVLTGDISTNALHAIASRSCAHLDKPVETTKLLCAIAHLLDEPTQMTTPDGATEASGDAPLVNVFVVDDDASIRDAIRDMLEAHGWSVETFASCDAFLHALRPGQGGCLVIDALLPEMDGFELLSRLEADKITLPSIMITGHGDISMAVRAMQAGASDFLEKPFGHEELIASITHALAQNREFRALIRAPRGRRAIYRPDRASKANSRSRARRTSQQEHRRGSRHQPAHGGEPPGGDHAQDRITFYSGADTLGGRRGLKAARRHDRGRAGANIFSGGSASQRARRRQLRIELLSGSCGGARRRTERKRLATARAGFERRRQRHARRETVATRSANRPLASRRPGRVKREYRRRSYRARPASLSCHEGDSWHEGNHAWRSGLRPTIFRWSGGRRRQRITRG